MASNKIPKINNPTTGTFQDVYHHLVEEDRKRISAECMEYLGQKRASSKATRCESTTGEAFKTTNGFYYQDDDAPVEACATNEELWDRVYMPPAARESMSKEQMAFFHEEMPATGPFVYTQMDLSAKNILVENGNFAGFASEDRAGFFPDWWQGRAFWLLWVHSNHDMATVKAIDRLQAKGKDLSPEMHSFNCYQAIINKKWVRLLVNWYDTEDTQRPFLCFPDSPRHALSWFYYLYSTRNGANHEDLEGWKAEMVASRADS